MYREIMMNLLMKFLIGWGVDRNTHSGSPRRAKAKRWGDRPLIGFLMLCLFAAAQPVQAEGSRELTANGGDRAYLDARSDATSGIPRRTTIRVFARVGETINLGSSTTGLGAATISFLRPDGTGGACTPGEGFIANLSQELAGPGQLGGYTPCAVLVDQEGIWEVDFQSPNPANSANPTANPARAPWTQTLNDSWVTAWDATVSTGGALGSGGTALSGRVFTNYLPLNMGSFDASLAAEVFFLTRDGYEYRFRSTDLQPFGFIFFANREGFLNANGEPLYQSVEAPSAQPVPIHNPNLPDNPATNDVTYKLFFNRPALDLPGGGDLAAQSASGFTWLRNLPTPPPNPDSFVFTGVEGTPGISGNAPLGGTFTFEANGEGTATIEIDFGNPAVPNRVLISQVTAGLNTITWDGTDQDGNPAPVGAVAYGASLTIATGEIHFPLLDAENNPSGVEIERLTPGAGNPFTIYYDDSGFTTNLVGAPNPIQALTGISSVGGAHSFGSDGAVPGFGDRRGIDTWTFISSPPIQLAGGLLVQAADLKIEKEGEVEGRTVTFTVTVENSPIPAEDGGSSDVIGAIFTDTVPEEITDVSWTCVASTGASCTESGTGNEITDTINLPIGGTVTYTMTGIGTPEDTITNTATVQRPDDLTDPIDDDGESIGIGPNRTESDSVTLTVGSGEPILGVAKQRGTIVNNGDGTFNVPFTVLVENLGNEPINDLQLVEDLFGGADSAFAGVEAISVVEPPTIVSGPLTATNPDFDGEGDRDLLSGTETLEAGEQATVTFTALVTPGNQLGPFFNSVVATGADPGGNPVTDVSTDQTDVDTPTSDPDDDGDPGNNDTPTETNFEANPNLQLVKRITSVLRNGVPLAGVDVNQVINDSEGANALNQAGLSPVGVLTLPSNVQLQSGDEVEYTLYFLSNGSSPALNVQLCDQIPVNTDFLTNGYATGQGIRYRSAESPSPTNITNVADADAGRYFTPLAPLPTVCGPNQNNGAVVVNIGDIPVSGFGFVQFRTRVP